MWAKFFLIIAGISCRCLAGRLGVFSSTESRLWEEHPGCQEDWQKIWNALSSNGTWALKILDASTKIPSGILTGHFVDYGNYDECLEPGGDVRTHHCIASISPPPELINHLTGGDPGLTPPSPLRWSYCLPISCPAIALQKFLKEILTSYLGSHFNTELNVTVADSDCKSKAPKSISRQDYVGISIWGIFVGLVVFSTIYDVAVEKTNARRRRLLSSFSLYTNGKSLLKTETSSETMLPLQGLRFLSICWVVLGHRYFFASTSPLLNLKDFAEELKKIQSQFFLQGVLAVDTFFLLSGLLNCYHLLNVLEKMKRFPIAKYYIHRYIRLTPALAAIVIMYATWYTLIGDGPAWDQTTAMWKQLCVDNWLPTLLYVNNYYNPLSQCAGQSWYLAVDMQLYWLSPLIIIPLWKRPRLGKALLWALLILSVISQFLVAFIYRFRMSFTFNQSPEEMEKVTKLIYVPTHARATPYIIGVKIGYYLHNLRKTNTRLVMSKGAVSAGWLLSTVMALSVFFGNYQLSRPIADHPYNRWESSAYIALHRIGWGLALGWIIMACLSRCGGIVNDILSWKAFIPLSRLTYCIFLCHMAIQQYHLGTMRTSDYFQYFNQVHRYFGDMFFSVMAAAGLSLIFESPIMVLEKLLWGGPQKRDLKSEVNNGFQDDSNTTDKTHEI